MDRLFFDRPAGIASDKEEGFRRFAGKNGKSPQKRRPLLPREPAMAERRET
jgi:hypothetical protein